MVDSMGSIDFDDIRAWRGAGDGTWRAIVYQLPVTVKHDCPDSGDLQVRVGGITCLHLYVQRDLFAGVVMPSDLRFV